MEKSRGIRAVTVQEIVLNVRKTRNKIEKIHKGKCTTSIAKYSIQDNTVNRDLQPTTNFKSVNKKEVK